MNNTAILILGHVLIIALSSAIGIVVNYIIPDLGTLFAFILSFCCSYLFTDAVRSNP
jgi:hypothetical protein